MSLLDAQQQRLLDRLGQAGDQPVAFTELHAAGITFPAAIISELPAGRSKGSHDVAFVSLAVFGGNRQRAKRRRVSHLLVEADLRIAGWWPWLESCENQTSIELRSPELDQARRAIRG